MPRRLVVVDSFPLLSPLLLLLLLRRLKASLVPVFVWRKAQTEKRRSRVGRQKIHNNNNNKQRAIFAREERERERERENARASSHDTCTVGEQQPKTRLPSRPSQNFLLRVPRGRRQFSRDSAPARKKKIIIVLLEIVVVYVVVLLLSASSTLQSLLFSASSASHGSVSSFSFCYMYLCIRELDL